LLEWPNIEAGWKNPDIAADVIALRECLAGMLNEPLEALRQQKTIGQSLDAKAVFTGPPSDPTFQLLQKYEADLPELFILSQVNLIADDAAETLRAEVSHADGVRCPRSWRWVPELVETEQWGPVSPRCAEALKATF
jgi:isoleucyl-tRNA synthetase